MASSRVPGSLFGWPPQDLKDGTSCRAHSPVPCPLKGTELHRVEQTTTASGGATVAQKRRATRRTVKKVDLSFEGRDEVIASLKSDATESVRQRAIEILIKVFDIDLSMTKSIRYDKDLPVSGRNLARDVRIGPEAYTESPEWLGQLVFHETIHSDQLAFYDKRGVKLADADKNSANSEVLRLLKALDEVECWYYSWRNRDAFHLSAKQIKEIERNYKLHMVDVDDSDILALVKKHQYHDARATLVSRLKP